MKLKTSNSEVRLSLNKITKKLINNQNDRYFDREISWLSFNERVLLQVYDKTIPYGERLRFVTISSENLDEFYMVRIAGLHQLISQGFNTVPETGMRADELFKTVLNASRDLQNKQQRCLNYLLNEKEDCDVSILFDNKWTKNELEWLKEYYEQNILPLLTPTTLDPAHPFPFIQNKGKCVLMEMKDTKNKNINCVVLLPDNIDRFIRLPGENQRYAMLENLVTKFVHLIYPEYKLLKSGMFRVIRDAEIEIDDEADDLIGQFETAIKARKRGGIAANKILSLPVRDLTHIERVWMAKVVYHRYVGTKDKQQIDKKIINLLSEKQKFSSYAIGLGLKFLYNFSAGLPKNLDSIKFKIKKNKLTCKIKPEAKALMDKENERRLKNFANACNLNCDII